MKGKLIFASLLGLLLFFLIISLMSAPKRINWRENFRREMEEPYGTAVLYALIPDLFSQATVEIVEQEMYYQLEENDYANSCYLIIDQQFMPDEYDLEYLFAYLEAGNYAFIAARDFSYEMADTFGFSIIQGNGESLGFSLEAVQDSEAVGFVNPQLTQFQAYDMIRSQESWGFAIEDSSRIKVLATNQYGQACLIRIVHEETFLILCSAPRMLSNYHLLNKNDHQFAATALSHIPEKITTLLWDEFYKTEAPFNGDPNQAPKEQPGLLSYINQEAPLRWAFWLLMSTLLLYAFFESKRKQRTIPVREPLPNATLEFTQTVGRLYYQSHDHKNVAEKKIKILLSFIRTHYFMQVPQFQPDPLFASKSGASPVFIRTLSGKSGMTEGELGELFRLIARIRQRNTITENELLELNMLTEKFYQIASHGRTSP